jgi:hypothetical protein
MSRYKAHPACEQSQLPIPRDRLAIVLVDCHAGIYSSALYSSLGRARSQVELAHIRDRWIEALLAQGIEPLRAAMFAMCEESRVNETLPKADLADAWRGGQHNDRAI